MGLRPFENGNVADRPRGTPVDVARRLAKIRLDVDGFGLTLQREQRKDKDGFRWMKQGGTPARERTSDRSIAAIPASLPIPPPNGIATVVAP